LFFAGSGKTTLLNAIAGKINIASGEITLNGMRYNKQLRRHNLYILFLLSAYSINEQ
jgi:ABC-type multidrug transport system ATPase subunit